MRGGRGGHGTRAIEDAAEEVTLQLILETPSRTYRCMRSRRYAHQRKQHGDRGRQTESCDHGVEAGQEMEVDRKAGDRKRACMPHLRVEF